MKRNSFVSRGAALVLSLLIMLAQLALPMSALALSASDLPGMTLYFETSSGSNSA